MISKIIKHAVVALLVCVSCTAMAQSNITWSVLLERANKPPVVAGTFSAVTKPIAITNTIDGIKISTVVKNVNGQTQFWITATSDQPDSCYLSLKANYQSGAIYTYLGEEKKAEIYRESPHNPTNASFVGIAMQDLPMIAIKDAAEFTIAINDSPIFYDNYTVQAINPETKEATLSSGDNGKTITPIAANLKIHPYYHVIKAGKPHVFNGIIVKSTASNVSNLRKDVLFAIAKRWNNITDRLGATSWASNYMLLRKNETGFSDYWVVPGIKYSNKEYTRDSFWQTMVLPAQYDAECYKHESVSQQRGSDRPLFTMIWAYRTKLNGGKVDMVAAQKSLDYIDAHIKDGKFYSNDNPKLKNFQYWLDVAAFDLDDVITANQGLMAVALMSAERLGLHPKTASAIAIKNYQAMFNVKGGYFPISEKKDMPVVDALMGDLLAQVFFDKKLLSDEVVKTHFNTMKKIAKTPYGYKVVCLPNGDYAPPEAYFAKDFQADPSIGLGPGNYQAGGSWFLYDMIFLMDSYLHKVPGAKDELIWRGSLDFKLGGTYFEYINTASGEPFKPNQGWNASIYGMWKKLMAKGLVDDSLLKAINQLQ
jgi:hypothetical protein